MRPGNDVNQLLLMACNSVNTTGVTNAAWWNACRLNAISLLVILLAVCCNCTGVGVGVSDQILLLLLLLLSMKVKCDF